MPPATYTEAPAKLQHDGMLVQTENNQTPSDVGDSEVLERLFAGRHSCRSFLPTPVPRSTIERIVALARRTASWCNSQPWQLLITRGDATHRFREGLMEAASQSIRTPDFDFPREYRGVYRQRRLDCGLALYESLGIAKGDREASARQVAENFRLFGAPHVVIVTSEETLGVYGAVDCGAFVSNFMLAAHAVQVASIAQAALASHSEFIRGHFGIPSTRRVVCGISFGYEDPAHPANSFRTLRAPVEDTVAWVE